MFNSKKFNDGPFNGGRKISVTLESVTITETTLEAEVYEASHVESVTRTETEITATVIRYAETESVTETETDISPEKLVHTLLNESITETETSLQYDIFIHGSAHSVTQTYSSLSATIRSYKTDPKLYEKSEPIFIYDKDERFVLLLSDDTIPHRGDFTEQLNAGQVLEFDVPAHEPDVALIEVDGRAVTRGPDGELVEFIIRKVEDIDDGTGTIKRVEAEGGEYELIDDMVMGYKASNVTLKTALSAFLSGTRWQVGQVDDFGTQSLDLSNMTVKAGIVELLEIFGGEVRYRVEKVGNRITNRYIDVLRKRGVNTGKRFEAGKDIVKASRLVDTSGIKTAMYGRGKSGENNEPRITFEDVVWSKENGDPVDKPKGQSWVGDPEALQKWGYAQGTQHRFGFYDGQEEDPAELLLNTWNELQKVKDANETYEFDLLLLEELTGMPHEKVRLGDTVYAVNHRVHPPIKVEMSIIEYKQNLNDRKLSSVVVGNFRRTYDIDSRFERVEQVVNDKEGKWDDKPDFVDVENEAQKAIDEATKRIEEAKKQLEQAMQNIEQTKIDLSDAAALIQDTIDNPQNYTGNFEGIVAMDSAVLRGTLTAMNARIVGTIQANNATLLNLTTENLTAIGGTFQDVVVTGQLDSVDGTFIGRLVGARILSNSTIDVRTDAKVGRNIELTNSTGYVDGRIAAYDGGLDIWAYGRMQLLANSVVFGESSRYRYDDFESEMIKATTETGNVGFRASNANQAAGTWIGGYRVNFRTRKSYVPSSISLSGSGDAYDRAATQINQYGFTFQIASTGPSEAIRYWYGTYTA